MAFLILLFLYHLLLLLPSLATSKCQESFQCGNHFPLEFPLSEDPRCGLFRVDGCSGPEFPVVRFDNTWYSYHIIDKISTNKFRILDLLFADRLRESLPKNPSVSFTIPSNLTLFTCYNRTSNERIQDHFSNYSRFINQDCEIPSPTVYYLYPSTDVPTAQETNIPTECGAIQMPIDPNKGKWSHLFELLTAEYTLEWNVSEECYECYHGGGQCLQNNRNEFHCGKGNMTLKKILFIGGMSMAALISTFIILFVFIWRKQAMEKQEHEKDIQLFLKNNGNLAPMRYKYSGIKKMTKSFSENLGKGGYGSVYKGELPDGHLVAVKILNGSNGRGEYFMNEVASVSRTSHINIVALLGYCFEGSKRALIYDFMPNGSLEKFIGINASAAAELGLGWEKLFKIEMDAERDDIGDLVGTMSEDESQVLKRNLMIVGLWCIQTNPKDRPSMTKVVGRQTWIIGGST